MDLRRPARAPPAPSNRNNRNLGLFHNHTSTMQQVGNRRQPAMSSTSSQSTLHIPAEEADPQDDLVARDSCGQYVVERIAKESLEGDSEFKDMVDSTEEDQIKELISMYGRKDSPYWGQEAVQNEIRSAMTESLEKKVASLDEDKWMFEGDSKTRG